MSPAVRADAEARSEPRHLDLLGRDELEQRRLTALGFDTKGADGRVGAGTMSAVSNYQRKIGMEPDGYAGVRLLARLRQGS